MYTCAKLSHFIVQQRLAQHCNQLYFNKQTSKKLDVSIEMSTWGSWYVWLWHVTSWSLAFCLKLASQRASYLD